MFNDGASLHHYRITVSNRGLQFVLYPVCPYLVGEKKQKYVQM